MKNRIPPYVIIFLGIAFIFLLWFYPSQIPAPWFDEGWTLATARNWIENGQYARLLNNEPISATGMAWNFPVTGPIALSFYFFGFGVWQGRLPNSLFTILSIFFIYLLARKMYNEKIAITSILILLLGFPFPLLYGRQAIGEPAMIFYLLAGYYIFWRHLEKHSIVSFGAGMLLWGLALTSKQQALPFWTLSMVMAVLFASIRRDTFIFWTTLSAVSGTLIAWQGMLKFQHLLEKNLPLYGAPMKGLLGVTGWAPILELRVEALILIVVLALPILIGLIYALFLERSIGEIEENTRPLFYLRLVYWSLISSWLFWFVTLAMPWARYLYPPAFLGSIFIAVLIFKLTDGLNFSRVINSISIMLRKIRFTTEGLKAIFCIILLSYMGSIVINRHSFIFKVPNHDAERIAEYLNQSMPVDAYIETYDSELLFLVQRRFHYPPDQVQVELNKRTFLGQSVEIQYDPMLFDPHYIVVGPFSNMWGLYNSTVAQRDIWKLIYELPGYKVYERVQQE
ncbi:MAG: glycosyltransferase family 39 protein [Bacteroidetes bacterium]|nr:glycosyltransferase family 39 protein [Bacteroidota bacterium]